VTYLVKKAFPQSTPLWHLFSGPFPQGFPQDETEPLFTKCVFQGDFIDRRQKNILLKLFSAMGGVSFADLG